MTWWVAEKKREGDKVGVSHTEMKFRKAKEKKSSHAGRKLIDDLGG